jgi:hypothetical protein
MELDNCKLKVSKHDSKRYLDKDIQVCIQEVFDGKESLNKYVKCISNEEVSIVCKELKLKKSIRQEWKEYESFKEVDDEHTTEVESYATESLEGEGIVSDGTEISLFGENDSFAKIHVAFSYFESDEIDYDFFNFLSIREHDYLCVLFKLTKESYDNLLHEVQNEKSRELIATINLNNVRCCYQNILELQYGGSLNTIKLMDYDAYRHLESEYSDEELDEWNMTYSQDVGTQFSLSFAKEVGNFEFKEDKHHDELEIDEVDEKYLTEDEKLEAEMLKRDKELFELEVNKNKTLTYIFWAIIVVGLAVALL